MRAAVRRLRAGAVTGCDGLTAVTPPCRFRFSGPEVNRPGGRHVREVVERVFGRPERRDSEFLRALYAQHGAHLLRYVLHLFGGDFQRAEDIVQETFLRAWQHRYEFAAKSAAPWLHTVAHNLVVSAYRRGAARPQESPLGEEEPPCAADDLERAVESWHMADALRELTPEHRAVLVQVYHLRRSVAEAAAHLGIREGAVKSLCYYALRALRTMLEERGVTAP